VTPSSPKQALPIAQALIGYAAVVLGFEAWIAASSSGRFGVASLAFISDVLFLGALFVLLARKRLAPQAIWFSGLALLALPCVLAVRHFLIIMDSALST